jgi:hypothetical protein
MVVLDCLLLIPDSCSDVIDVYSEKAIKQRNQTAPATVAVVIRAHPHTPDMQRPRTSQYEAYTNGSTRWCFVSFATTLLIFNNFFVVRSFSFAPKASTPDFSWTATSRKQSREVPPFLPAELASSVHYRGDWDSGAADYVSTATWIPRNRARTIDSRSDAFRSNAAVSSSMPSTVDTPLEALKLRLLERTLQQQVLEAKQLKSKVLVLQDVVKRQKEQILDKEQRRLQIQQQQSEEVYRPSKVKLLKDKLESGAMPPFRPGRQEPFRYVFPLALENTSVSTVANFGTARAESTGAVWTTAVNKTMYGAEPNGFVPGDATAQTISDDRGQRNTTATAPRADEAVVSKEASPLVDSVSASPASRDRIYEQLLQKRAKQFRNEQHEWRKERVQLQAALLELNITYQRDLLALQQVQISAQEAQLALVKEHDQQIRDYQQKLLLSQQEFRDARVEANHTLMTLNQTITSMCLTSDKQNKEFLDTKEALRRVTLERDELRDKYKQQQELNTALTKIQVDQDTFKETMMMEYEDRYQQSITIASASVKAAQRRENQARMELQQKMDELAELRNQIVAQPRSKANDMSGGSAQEVSLCLPQEEASTPAVAGNDELLTTTTILEVSAKPVQSTVLAEEQAVQADHRHQDRMTEAIATSESRMGVVQNSSQPTGESTTASLASDFIMREDKQDDCKGSRLSRQQDLSFQSHSPRRQDESPECVASVGQNQPLFSPASNKKGILKPARLFLESRVTWSQQLSMRLWRSLRFLLKPR